MNKKQSFFLFLKFFLMGVILIWSLPGLALQEGTSGKLIEYLAAEKVNLTITNSNLRSFSMPITKETLSEQKERIATQLTLISAKIDTLNGFLVSQEKKQSELKTRLKQFKQSSSTSTEALVLQESVNQVRALIKVNEKGLELIADNLTLAHQYQKTLYQRERQLVLWEADEEKKRIFNLKKAAIAALDQKRTLLYEKNITLERQKKSGLRAEARGVGDEGILLLNNQNILLIDSQATLIQWEMKLAEADYEFLSRTQDVKTLETIIDVYDKAEDHLGAMIKSLVKMQQALSTEALILSSDSDKQEMLSLQTKVTAFQEEVRQLESTVHQVLEEKQAVLKKQRASRQRFEDYKQRSFTGVMHEITQVPVQFYQYLRTLCIKVLDNYSWEDIWFKASFWSILVFISAALIAIRRLLQFVTQEKTRSRFSGHLYDGALLLLYRGLPQILVVILLMTSLVLNQVVFVQLQLLVHLLLIWLVYRLFKGIAQLVLLEQEHDAPGHELILYRRFKWLFLMGSWSTGLMVLGQELPLSFLLQDVFNRLFMVFLFAVAWVLWKSRETFPQLFHPWFRANKRPFKHLLSFLSFLIPIILFTTAMIGLLGYTHLAWILGRYQAYFLLVVIVYVLLRELLSDLLDLLSERMVSRLKNGWLWVEAILKPLEKWLHFGLFFLSILVIFRGFKDNWEFAMLSGVKAIGTYPIFSGSEVHITLFSTISAVVILMVLIWLSKWTREFCYRWLYRGMIDTAIRNSISIFTQYTVILLGAFIFLRVLGVDLSGMGMVLGGLAVGMGFGLRDFASNIVGGVMLLIERPVREGDLITLGEYEGRVEHIGIRSMRVSSWDHMDVLIPNAETFNKPVTNWTHQDGVVRTVLPIKVNRTDSPEAVQQLIFEVLSKVSGVLKEPPAQVFLKQIDEALIEFEVRYFINIQFSLRVGVRSEVLLAIMAKFKEAGIQPPIPPFRIEVEPNTQVKDDKHLPPE
ncbi:MAG: mechanosensitive ion channel [Gammaproteobacteria bacterium]|nr:mechanosensitive ion channel [Gammaproteobacteria bacterium]